MQRPEPSEHYEYYGLYIGKVPEGNIISILDEQLVQTLDTLSNLPPEVRTTLTSQANGP